MGSGQGCTGGEGHVCSRMVGGWACSVSKVCADLLCEETKCSGLAGGDISIGEHRGHTVSNLDIRGVGIGLVPRGVHESRLWGIGGNGVH